ncbi:unnamed protein product [Ambrosiozyma monospora]|uniref:Unnamed protein product n=1 Tax=Ambrosiozyma monospora TaxID=43982 RepID=A0A9W6WBM9_AMBMO|nr:unnamed protein product [Ambrosiozyma monospora]
MQFSSALIFAASALAVSSVVETKTNQETDMVTITSCGPTVTNCPAASHASVASQAKNGTNSITTYEAAAASFGSYYVAGAAAFAAGALLL